jgi:hypothetical protein
LDKIHRIVKFARRARAGVAVAVPSKAARYAPANRAISLKPLAEQTHRASAAITTEQAMTGLILIIHPPMP